MAGDGAGAHTTSASVLDLTVAVAARNGVMSKRSGRHKVKMSRLGCHGVLHARPFLDLAWRKGSFILNLPSHHSITSLAIASSNGGTSKLFGGLEVDDQFVARRSLHW